MQPGRLRWRRFRYQSHICDNARACSNDNTQFSGTSSGASNADASTHKPSAEPCSCRNAFSTGSRIIDICQRRL